MTPERRDELRRADDAVKHARYTLDRKNYMATIEAQEERIKALESLLARSGCMIVSLKESIKDEFKYILPSADSVIAEIDAILPATEGKSDAAG